MPSTLIRPFQRHDREQVTELVNAHIGAVLPGVSISVNAVMSQLEREPGEIIVHPWVRERATLVAACTERFESWGVDRCGADMSLPCPCCYGVLDCWPHLKALFLRNGFRQEGHTEVILVADAASIPTGGDPPLAGLTLRRDVGGTITAGTRFGAWLGDELAGFVLLATDLTNGGTLSRLAGWGEIDTFSIGEEHRRKGIATWLLGHAADWLRLGRGDRLIAYCEPGQQDVLGFAAHSGFRELARTERGWMR